MDDNISKLSLELRKQWGIDSYSPINIFSLVETNIRNLTIIWTPTKYNINACCSKDENLNIITINSKHSKGKQNFTLAHELYHLLYSNEKIIICDEDNKDENEEKADKFASYLLIPKDSLENYIKQKNIDYWTYMDIINCEQYYQINHKNDATKTFR